MMSTNLNEKLFVASVILMTGFFGLSLGLTLGLVF
jgi:hypothetical protein